jgi:hypothetical protein
MTHPKTAASFLGIVFLSLAAWTGCSNSNSSSNTSNSRAAAAPASISAAGGAAQSAAAGTPFTTPLTVTVLNADSNPVAGVAVIFTAPSVGASGTFANSSATETVTTNASGRAKSSTFTANAKTGSYTVAAVVPGVSATDFALTNTAPPPASISVYGGVTQSASAGAGFNAPLIAAVRDAHSNPVAGVAVVFTAPSSGASGTFANSSAKETVTTNASGVATSSTFTANSTAGSYTVTAAVSGVSTPAEFTLTNAPPNISFAFYLYGTENNGGYKLLALAGSVIIDTSGNVISGEQDYNDANGITSPEPGGDTITGGSLSVDPTTGQGTLALVTNNSSVGVSGTETLGVQFVNAKHARVITFDGTGTSSGSMDAQTLPSVLSGGFAFACSGVDASYNTASLGGVFTVSGTEITNGVIDVDDAGSVIPGTSFTTTISAADSHGRGSFSISDINFVYYIVGPEVLRVIDIDEGEDQIGSAYGQGASVGTFSNASLGASVLGTIGNAFEFRYAWAGQITTDSEGNFTGWGDYNEQGYGENYPISGTYSLAGNGYGALAITSFFGFVSQMGIYATDPNLNLLDPNNTASGLGGALVVDLDADLTGIGFATPQTDTSTADFTGTYVFGMQDTNDYENPFDYVGQGTVTSLALSGTGLVSDPFGDFGYTVARTGVQFSTTLAPDLSNPGRYSLGMLQVEDPTLNLQVAAYQASGTQLYWLDEDETVVGLGFIEQQGSLTAVPGLKKRQAQATPKQKRH